MAYKKCCSFHQVLWGLSELINLQVPWCLSSAPPTHTHTFRPVIMFLLEFLLNDFWNMVIDYIPVQIINFWKADINLNVSLNCLLQVLRKSPVVELKDKPISRDSCIQFLNWCTRPFSPILRGRNTYTWEDVCWFCHSICQTPVFNLWTLVCKTHFDTRCGIFKPLFYYFSLEAFCKQCFVTCF